jgi:hypothetical protein
MNPVRIFKRLLEENIESSEAVIQRSWNRKNCEDALMKFEDAPSRIAPASSEITKWNKNWNKIIIISRIKFQ